MTRNQKRKQARHNAEKDAKRTRLTVADAERVQSDLRKQEAVINARLEEKRAGLEDEWYTWVAWHDDYVIPRISAGFYLAALRAGRKRMIKQVLEEFMDELGAEMQRIITEAGDEGLDDTFDKVAEELDKLGYAVPEWAKREDLETVKKLAKGEKV